MTKKADSNETEVTTPPEPGVVTGPDEITYAEPQEMGDGRFLHRASLLGNSLSVYTDTRDTKKARAALKKALDELTADSRTKK